MRLKEKVTLITGAGHGLGKAYALRFAAEGARVVIAEIDEPAGRAAAQDIAAAGGLAWFRHTDVTDSRSVHGLVAETRERFGRIDVLLNNAAIYETQKVWTGPLEHLPDDEWDRLMAVNLKGVFLCCKAAIPVMKAQAGEGKCGGKIINVASGTFFLGLGDMPHYTASKGGVIGLTRVMAKQLGAWNISVNCFTPGSTMSEDVVTDEIRARRERAIGTRVFRRVQVPEDVVGTALFLASSDSDFMTGQCLVVEGGSILY